MNCGVLIVCISIQASLVPPPGMASQRRLTRSSGTSNSIDSVWKSNLALVVVAFIPLDYRWHISSLVSSPCRHSTSSSKYLLFFFFFSFSQNSYSCSIFSCRWTNLAASQYYWCHLLDCLVCFDTYYCGYLHDSWCFRQAAACGHCCCSDPKGRWEYPSSYPWTSGNPWENNPPKTYPITSISSSSSHFSSAQTSCSIWKSTVWNTRLTDIIEEHDLSPQVPTP